MMKHEFEERLGSQVTESEYKDIEFVYTFHPVISNTEGKTQIAQLYKIGGMRLIKDMLPTARKAQELDNKIMAANANLMRLKRQSEMLANGEESEEIK